MTVVLWGVEMPLALLFLFAGGMKLILPIEDMTKQMPVPIPGLFPGSSAWPRCSAGWA